MKRVSADEIITTYEHTLSVKSTARMLGVSHDVVRRTLCAVGIYSTDHVEEINKMYKSGKSISEIAELVGISEKAVIQNLPHTKGSYSTTPQTKNARKIQACRERKKIKGE